MVSNYLQWKHIFGLLNGVATIHQIFDKLIIQTFCYLQVCGQTVYAQGLAGVAVKQTGLDCIVCLWILQNDRIFLCATCLSTVR